MESLNDNTALPTEESDRKHGLTILKKIIKNRRKGRKFEVKFTCFG